MPCATSIKAAICVWNSANAVTIRVSYSLSHEGEHLGLVVFRRNQRFSEQEQGNLESLLAALLYPMRNALLYRAATQSALRDPLTGPVTASPWSRRCNARSRCHGATCSRCRADAGYRSLQADQ
jgi:GAF domain-containing protein